MLLLLLPLVLAVEPPHVMLATGPVAGAGLGAPTGALGGWGASLGVELAPEHPAVPGLEFHVREGLASASTRMVGGLAADLRWPAAPGPHVAVGFAHHHETDIELVLDHPVAATLATLPGIVHRTGFEVGVGTEFPSPWAESGFARRLRPAVSLWTTVLPASAGPLVYVTGEVTCTLRLGREDSPG